MRRGFDAQLVFSKSGALVAIATGSDACAEHEQGSKPLQLALCTNYDDEDAMVSALASGKDVAFKPLLDRKRISKVPKELQYVELPVKDGEPPEALLGLAREPLQHYLRELAYPYTQYGKNDLDVSGAWDQGSFAIRVRGKKYVKALRQFYAAMQEKKCLFAGSFLTELSGCVIANSERLNDAAREAMKQAQLDYESNLRLKAKDDSSALMREMNSLGQRGSSFHFGFIWVSWADESQNKVAYCINPDSNLDVQYGGPYTREQLLDWARNRFSTPLRPLKPAALA